MTNVVTVKNTNSGVIKNRKKYPNHVIAMRNALISFAENAKGYNDCSALDFFEFPILTVDNISPKEMCSLQAYLAKTAGDLTVFNYNELKRSCLCEIVDATPLYNALQKLENNETTLSVLCHVAPRRDALVHWLDKHAPHADVYLDQLHIKQLTEIEIRQRAEDAELDALIAAEEVQLKISAAHAA